MTKKILIFSTAYLPLVGGAEIAVKELTDRLAGFDFDLITARIERKLIKQEKVGRIMVYRVGLGCKLDKFLLPIFGLIKVIQLNRKNNYQIIWSIMASQASIAAAGFKMIFSNKKLVLNLQEGDDEEHLKRYVLGNALLYKILIRPWHLLVFKRADYITAISADLKNRAASNGVKATMEIIPNGVDIKRFIQEYKTENLSALKSRLGKLADDKFIITSSRLVRKNAVNDIIRALEYLPDNIKLLILGAGPDENSLKSLVKELKLEKRIFFLGHIEHEELPKYLKISDIFIRPSLSEGLGNSFLEAMASGVPIIGTRVGGIVDFLRDDETGLFCEVRNPESIAEKIKIYLANKALTDKIRINARELVIKNYDWDLIAKRMEKIFEKLIV
ncbi:MAG: glycosyltransferase family 4 protein [bacterium]|nr:glycosyltransferase family 4 protein [bacterium]